MKSIFHLAALTLIYYVCGIHSKSFVFTSDQKDFTSMKEDRRTCGYPSCNPVKDGMINVHIVPHTHDDVGWIITVDQYYYQRVQYILDTVIHQLEKDPSRRFIYVEIAYFKRWWDEQDDETRHRVKALVNQGRFEFILGGWSMNDEACTHYNAIIDQHTLGLRFLQETFGDCARPRVAWQIDPFGHSKEQASLFAQMGYDGLFFGRLDYQDKAARLNTSTMEMIWKGSADLGTSSNLFTGALYSGYGPPDGICFAYGCTDPIQDDPSLHDYNVPQKVTQFLKDVTSQAAHYATDHLVMTMGSDFEYTDAVTWFKNLDKLIKYVNEQNITSSKVNLLYSTPSCYLYQLNRANRTWTTKEDDFFPYAHRPHSFWTGYFTSRPALKGYVRRTNNFLQVCKQMDALAQLQGNSDNAVNIEVLKEAMGVAQHHDGVSGTEKQAVAYDYAERLANGVNECQKTVVASYRKLLSKSGTEAPFDHQFCTLLNISMCETTENSNQFVMVVYNPLGRTVTRWVRLPVTSGGYTVTNPDGQFVQTQMVSVSDRTERIPERNSSIATHVLVFNVTVPALGYATYFVSKTSETPNFVAEFKDMEATDTEISNKYISLSFDAAGKLSSITNKEDQLTVTLEQEFAFYTGFVGNNSHPELQASGAYIFRPNEHLPHTFNTETVTRTRFAQGELVQEVEQTFSPWVTQVIRLYKDAKFAELEWTVGPIPLEMTSLIGKEVINRFKTDLVNKGFFTDANGRQVLPRQVNFRPTWKLNQTEPVAGNYFPINSRIYIQDVNRNTQFAVLTDRSEGGSSLRSGELEIMVHRRLLHDDNLGVNEALNELGSDDKGLLVRGTHYLSLNHIEKAASAERDLALQLYMSPSLSFIPTTLSYMDWIKDYKTKWSGLLRELPKNVHLLTLEQWKGSSYLARLEHLYEAGEDAVLSKPAHVSLAGLFTPFNVTSSDELMLGANQKKADSHRLVWNTINADELRSSTAESSDSREVTLTNMQIKTFQLSLSADDESDRARGGM